MLSKPYMRICLIGTVCCVCVCVYVCICVYACTRVCVYVYMSGRHGTLCVRMCVYAYMPSKPCMLYMRICLVSRVCCICVHEATSEYDRICSLTTNIFTDCVLILQNVL